MHRVSVSVCFYDLWFGSAGTFSARSLYGVAMMSSSSGCKDAGSGPGASPGRLLRLSAVPGYEQHRINDVLLLRPEPRETLATRSENAHVVFFPGDIQVSLSLQPEHRDLSCSLG